MVSIVRGRITGTPSTSDWNCISNSLRTIPPSTFSVVSRTPLSASMASMTSRDWYAAASRAARAMCPLLMNRVSPTIAPRASPRQYGANNPLNAGTK